jgi:N-sulfoglucosamine sulfohydrolase
MNAEKSPAQKPNWTATLRGLLAALTLAPAAAIAAESTPHSQPNIVLITSDDLGLQLSCYGETRIATPYLDALAAQGLRFRNGYVAQASCSPSRASLLTGRWPHQNGQIGLSHLGFRVNPGEPSLPAILRQHGYFTGIIGKLHVEPKAAFPFDVEGKSENVNSAATRDVQWVAQEGGRFFQAAREAGKPFFYYVNYFDPHAPLDDSTDVVNGLPKRRLAIDDIRDPIVFGPSVERNRLMTARYLNTVARLDAGVGLLMRELEQAGVAQNTLVIFIGDNGIDGLNGRGKTTSFEGGVRVPFMLRWPAAIEPKQVRDELVMVPDLMPTILNAAGLNTPEGLAGAALQPLFKAGPAPWREYLFTEMTFHTPGQFKPARTVRDARHKLMLNLAPTETMPAVALYDLQNDPWETQNLAGNGALADTQARLTQALQAWRQQTEDPLLDPQRVTRWKELSECWQANLPRLPGPWPVVAITETELAKLSQ